MNKTLFRTALITSPIIGVYNVIPVFLFLESTVGPQALEEMLKLSRIMQGLPKISLYVFVTWCINILLYHIFVRLAKKSDRNYDLLRILLSYLITTSMILLVAIGSGERIRPEVELGSFRYYPIIGSIANNTLILLMLNYIVSRKEKEILQTQKSELEIGKLLLQQEKLKEQVHPHFLFNALTTLQILMTKEPEKAKKYASDLASYLRQSIDLTKNNLVSIKEDVRFFEQYLELQKMRFGGGINYKVNIPDNALTEHKIPVHTLQILGENAVKHNAFSTTNPIEIRVDFTDDHFLKVSNNKIPKFREEPSTKTGIANLQKRFNYLSEHIPVIEETDEMFSVTVKAL